MTPKPLHLQSLKSPNHDSPYFLSIKKKKMGKKKKKKRKNRMEPLHVKLRNMSFSTYRMKSPIREKKEGKTE